MYSSTTLSGQTRPLGLLCSQAKGLMLEVAKKRAQVRPASRPQQVAIVNHTAVKEIRTKDTTVKKKKKASAKFTSQKLKTCD